MIVGTVSYALVKYIQLAILNTFNTVPGPKTTVSITAKTIMIFDHRCICLTCDTILIVVFVVCDITIG
jgi:hypothetical protein